MNAYPLLFAPGTIARVELKNRIVQTPMGTGLIDMGQVTTREVAFQEERARGGVGLIITGAAVVHPTSRFPARIITEAWDPDGIPALRLRTDAVHRHGAAHLRPADPPRARVARADRPTSCRWARRRSRTSAIRACRTR